MSKARELSKLLSGTLKVGALQAPAGTTAQRPSGQVGMLRYNNDLQVNEIYAAGSWGAIAPPPIVTTVSPSSFNGEQGTLFTINGTGFGADAAVKFISNTGVEYTAAVVTRVSSTQLTATTPQDFTVAQEPFDVKVVQGSGSSTLDNCIDCGGVPTWNTASGNLGTMIEDETNVSIQLSAGDPDAGATISYAMQNGSTLPTGLVISNSGLITGIPNVNDAYASSVTYNFTVNAIDNAGNTTPRLFNIIKKWRDGSTQALSVNSAKDLQALGITADGSYYIKSPANNTGELIPCIMSTKGGGWMKVTHIPKNTNLLSDEYWNGTQGAGGSFGSGVTGASGTPGSASRWYRYPSYWATNSSGSNLDLMVTVEGYGSGTVPGESMIGSIFRDIRLDLGPFDVQYSRGYSGGSVSQTIQKSNDGINFTSYTVTPNLSSGWLLSFGTDGGVIGYNSTNGGYILHESPTDVFTNVYGWIEGTGVVGSNQTVTAANMYIRVR